MHNIYIIILLVVMLYSIKKEKNIYNPLTVFTGIWALTMLLSSLQLYELYETSERAYLMAFLGCIFFALGVGTRKKMKIKTQKIAGINSAMEYELNYKFLLTFYTAILVFTASLASVSIALLMRGVSMETIRFNYRNVEAGLVIDNNLSYIIENYFVQASVFASTALIPVVLGDKQSLKKWILLLELLLLQVLYIFVSGARSFLIDVAFLFIIYILINRKFRASFREYYNKIPKFVVRVIVIGAIAVVVFMTTLRKGEERSILRELYRYIAISFPLFDAKLNMAAEPGHIFTHGWTLLNGFTKPLFYAFRRFTHIPYPSGLTEAISQIAANNDFLYVGGGRANSFVTIFYYMYMDFGVLGIIVESFLYGYFCQSSYKSMVINPNRRSQAFYLLVTIGIVLSFTRLHFTAHRYVYAFVILFFSFLSSHNQRKRV